MPAPTANLPIFGNVVTAEGRDAVLNDALRQLWLGIMANATEEQIAEVLAAAASAAAAQAYLAGLNDAVRNYEYLATEGQTVFTGADINANTLLYRVGRAQVFRNGVRMNRTIDYTETNENTLTFAYPLTAGDRVNIDPLTFGGARGDPGPAGLSFESVEQFADWLVLNPIDTLGTVVDAGGMSFVYTGRVVTGLTGLSGWEPLAPLVPPQFGAVAGVTDSQAAISRAWDYGADSTSTVLMDKPFASHGSLITSSGLHVRWANNAWTYQTGFSPGGSFIENLNPNSGSPDTIMSRLTFENPHIDGQFYPVPLALEIVSATNNPNPSIQNATVVFTNAASAVDGSYLGYALEDTTGANAGGLRIITSYNGATRTAVHATRWVSPPAAGTIVLAGWNDNAFGFAAGVSEIDIIGGRLRNYPANIMVPSGTGGKGVNFEQGVTAGKILNLHVEDCGTAYFVQGRDGSFANTAKRRAVSIILGNLTAKNCGSAFTVAGVNSDQAPDGDSDDSMLILSGMTFENCGHSPWRIVSGGKRKSGAINLAEAQNATLSNIRGRNDSTYPTVSPGYPTDYATRCGFGLSGPIGAMIWGHGRNIKITDYVLHAAVDNVIRVERCRALGDDAGGGDTPGQVRNCLNWQFRGIEHHGPITEYVIRVDSFGAFQVPPDELTGYIEVSIDATQLGIGMVDPFMAAFGGIVLDITDRSSGKRIIGTPQQIRANGNNFSLYRDGLTDLRVKDVAFEVVRGRQYTLANHTAISIPAPEAAGILTIIAQASELRMQVSYRTGDTPQIAHFGTLPGSTAITTGALTGTTGSDGFFTVSAGATNIHLENRRGASVPFSLRFDV